MMQQQMNNHSNVMTLPVHYGEEMVEVYQSRHIQMKDIVIKAGNTPILSILELSFPDKGVVAIMGPSGCGKSSLLRVLADLQNECISYDGYIDVRCCTEEQIIPSSRFAMVWQQPVVFPCSIWDNLKIPLQKRRVPKAQWQSAMTEALKATSLFDELGDRPWKRRADCLSGGQKQRLCIAMGLLKDADIMLLDEPTSALDPKSTEKIEKVIKELSKTKLVILVTHSIGQAKRLSEYTAMFTNGQHFGELTEYAQTDKIFNNPKSECSKLFIRLETGT